MGYLPIISLVVVVVDILVIVVVVQSHTSQSHLWVVYLFCLSFVCLPHSAVLNQTCDLIHFTTILVLYTPPAPTCTHNFLVHKQSLGDGVAWKGVGLKTNKILQQVLEAQRVLINLEWVQSGVT